ncbi:glutamate racemase [Gottfriedia luciferensis]|jgi:glutamate racemase|uniref:Glutamate racemase n=1 Tax=Gottfriedia luciferensis TaxID=178774 RepID=A0ABX2ZJK1_9BACI|nr:glutamate racemase [Gottfriedia luciferensis]ODG89881.1 glutamate racemase [Gottfriedia luciferensis]
MRIAFFDSGIGGLTVLNEALKKLPNEDFLYFADTLHVPYGTKSKEEVSAFVKKSVETIIKEDVKALVIACNTATSIAVNELREMYDFPIIGMEPAVKPAVEMNRTTGKRVLVFATPLTLKQTKYNELISRVDDLSIVDSLPLPELVHYCEELNFDENFMIDYFKSKLSLFNIEQYGTIVLGCTHYPFYRNILKKILPEDVQIVDGSNGTVKRLIQLLGENGQLNETGQTNVKFMCSNNDIEYIEKTKQALSHLQNER